MQVLPKQAYEWAAEFARGMPVTFQQALAYAWSRVNGRIDQGAFMQPALVSRTLGPLSAGQSQQTTIQLGTALLVTSISERVYVPDADDDTSMVTAQIQLPNTQGLLMGDPGTYFNLSLLAEAATWLPLTLPWVLFPSDQTTYTAQASNALTGTATAVLGLQGVWIYGLI